MKLGCARLGSVLLVLVMASCTVRQENVAPATVNESRYVSLSCAELIDEEYKARQRLAVASFHQGNVKFVDRIVGTSLLLEQGPSISQAKGEILVIQQVHARKCATSGSR